MQGPTSLDGGGVVHPWSMFINGDDDLEEWRPVIHKDLDPTGSSWEGYMDLMAPLEQNLILCGGCFSLRRQQLSIQELDPGLRRVGTLCSLNRLIP